MLSFGIAGMTFVAANVSALIVAVLLCTKLRSRYYVCIWSLMALINGLVGRMLFPLPLLEWGTLSGMFFGVLGLLVWSYRKWPPWIARSFRVPEPQPYYGQRCVACNQPIDEGVVFCPKCGWTQPVYES